MNTTEIILLIVLLGFQAFQFVTILNIIKKIINSLQDRIHEIIKDEISILLNDKDLYDSLKEYLGSLVQGALGKLQPRNSNNNMLQALIGTILQRFIPGPLGELTRIPTGSPESTKNVNMEGKISKNPFTK